MNTYVMITGTSVLSSGTHHLVLKSLVFNFKIAIISENYQFGQKSAYF